VTNLLEGSVRKQGDRVRIVAELINAADGRALWSETYDRELKDVFAVQKRDRHRGDRPAQDQAPRRTGEVRCCAV
jgi:TolB-like protein